MSELDSTWEIANKIADDICDSGNMNWASHLRGSIQLGKSLEKRNEQLQSKIDALSIAVADNDIDEVKRLLPLSGEQVAREIKAEAIEKLIDDETSIARVQDNKRSLIFVTDARLFANQLRNPEQEK